MDLAPHDMGSDMANHHQSINTSEKCTLTNKQNSHFNLLIASLHLEEQILHFNVSKAEKYIMN
jgi:hypothetical protein